MKILLHHTVVIDSRCVRAELEDIDQERLDIDVFLAFFFLLIRPRDLHCTDTSLLSKRRSISRVHTKIVVPEHIQRGRNFVTLKLAEDIKLRRK